MFIIFFSRLNPRYSALHPLPTYPHPPIWPINPYFSAQGLNPVGKMEDPEADDCSNGSSGPIALEESRPGSPNSDSKLAGNFEKSLSKCSVCLEPTDNNHLHYGAITCFSCRAFFRRANQKSSISKKSIYICKQENSCDISFKNRKKCQKCRFV